MLARSIVSDPDEQIFPLIVLIAWLCTRAARTNKPRDRITLPVELHRIRLPGIRLLGCEHGSATSPNRMASIPEVNTAARYTNRLKHDKRLPALAMQRKIFVHPTIVHTMNKTPKYARVLERAARFFCCCYVLRISVLSDVMRARLCVCVYSAETSFTLHLIPMQ